MGLRVDELTSSQVYEFMCWHVDELSGWCACFAIGLLFNKAFYRCSKSAFCCQLDTKRAEKVYKDDGL